MPHSQSAPVDLVRRSYRVVALIVIAGALAGCGSDDAPTAPTSFDPPGTHQAVITGVGSTAIGGISVTPRAAGGVFTADFKIRVHNAKPNTTYFVQRAAETGRALTNDGICQRGMNVSPWSSTDPAAPSFATFPQADGTTPVTLRTTATGEGSIDYSFSTAVIVAGTRFDVM